jgi:hypothetical protein
MLSIVHESDQTTNKIIVYGLTVLCEEMTSDRSSGLIGGAQALCRYCTIYFKTKSACVHIRWLSNTTRVVCFFHNAPIASLLRMYHSFGTVGSLRKHIYMESFGLAKE